MNRRLRGRHFRMAILLAIVVPLLLIAALAGRKRFPTQTLPAPLAGQTPP
jgi:hypothetical protein